MSVRSLLLTVYEPLWIGTEMITEIVNPDGYDHTISAQVGYDSMSFAMKGGQADAENWVEYGLGRHVQVTNPAGAVAWEGFINRITVVAGPLTLAVGPLMEVTNRCSVVYTPIINATTTPATTGTKTETTIAENTDSQAEYGIIERILTAGNCLDDGTTNDAEYVRDKYLEENAWPKNTSDLSFSQGSTITIKLECLGYYYWFEKYVYNDTTTALSVYLTTKMENVITADPNNIFSADYDEIDDNLLLTVSEEAENRTAAAIIKGLLAFGDVNGNKWNFGVYEGRRVHYESVPSQVEYYYYLFGGSQRVELAGGGALDPWDVLPGKWAFVPDFLVGAEPSALVDLRKDKRALFIEQVQFTTPNSLTLKSTNMNRLPQILAQLGLGGVG